MSGIQISANTSINEQNKLAIASKLRAEGLNESEVTIFMADNKIDEQEYAKFTASTSSVGTQSEPKPATTFTVGNEAGNLPNDLAEKLAGNEYGQILVRTSNDTYRLAEGKTINELQNAINEYNKTLPQTFKIPEILYNQLTYDIKSKLTATNIPNQYTTTEGADVHNALIAIQGCTAEAPITIDNSEDPNAKYNYQDVIPEYNEVVEEQPAFLTQEQIDSADLTTRKGRKAFKSVVAGKKPEANTSEEGSGLRGWLAHNNGENQDVADYTAVRMQHGRKIDRWTKKIEKEHNTYKSALEYYISLLPEDKKNEIIRQLGITDLTQEKKLEAECKSKGIDLKELCSMCATQKYLNSRSERQMNNLRDDFVEDMAEAEVDEYRYNQEYERTVPCFDKAQRKAAQKYRADDDTNIYTDIGDWGRKLVTSVPDLFCDEVTDNRTPDFQLNNKKYSFNPQKYKEFFAALAYDQSNDGMYFEQYLQDHKITLGEADRALLNKNLLGLNDQSLEEILHTGKKANEKVNYRERRRLKHAAEAAGINFEKDFTPRKRMLTVAGATVAGAALGDATGSLIKSTLPDELVQDGMERVVEHVPGPAGGYDNIFYKPAYKLIAGATSSLAGEFAIGGGIVGAGVGVLIARNQKANGTRFDHVINLEGKNKIVHHDQVKGDQKTLQLEPPKIQIYNYEQTIDTEKLVAYRGLEAYNVLYPNVGKKEFIEAYRKAFKDIFGNDLPKGHMPDKFYAIPITIGGNTIYPSENWHDTYKTITKGNPGGSNNRVNGKGNLNSVAQRMGYNIS